MNILSIQSWVSYGHVGNASAIFALQRAGAEVWGINTVQFSNHPGYGSHTGAVYGGDAVAALVDGIAARGVLPACDAVLSGYLGDTGTGDAVLSAVSRVRRANRAALYCCDPVIGDDGPGVYVKPGIADFFGARAIAAADVLTPNHFELQLLTGQACTTLDEVKLAVAALQLRMRMDGPRTVLVTSLRGAGTPADALDLIVGAGGTFHLLRTPLLPIAANGAGDAIAALFLVHLLRSGDAALAMSLAASSLHGVLRRTLAASARELVMVAAQDELARPSIVFAPYTA